MHNSGASVRDRLRRIHIWYATQFKALLDRLAALPEDGGSVLDHTLIVWLSEFSGHDGTNTRHHHQDDLSWVIAGDAGGAFRTGRSLDFANERLVGQRSHNDFWLSICQAMGLEMETFGDPRHCTGPVEELRG